MTNLVEQCVIKITMNHDIANSAFYHGPDNIEDWVKNAWMQMIPWFTNRRGVSNGKIELGKGAVTIEWDYTGVFEDVEAGDN